ncbi:sugar ABC transporter permease [Alicyclobacillaceae bacterium I2511]|nr:sugar ABC transporter permease [Alicyclobacillaceae bacterium I2511]
MRRYNDAYAYAYALTAPTLIILVVFMMAFLFAVYMSLTHYTLLNQVLSFDGLAHYNQVMHSPEFWESAWITIKYTVVTVTVQLVLGFAIALALHELTTEHRILQAIVILPLMIPPVMSSIIWQVMMNPSGGILNYVLQPLGVNSQWLASSSTAIWSIALIDVWIYTPFVTLILLAGLKALPVEPYEASLVDGANVVQQFRWVTLPYLRPYIIIAATFRIIGSLNVFDEVYATTAGGPGVSTTTLSVEIYKMGFQGNLLSYAVAIAVVLFIVVLVITQYLLRLWKEEEEH